MLSSNWRVFTRCHVFPSLPRYAPRETRAHGVGVTMYGFGDLPDVLVCRRKNTGVITVNGTCVEGDET